MSLESEGKEMSRLSTHIHTDRHVNIELEFCETEFAISVKMIKIPAKALFSQRSTHYDQVPTGIMMKSPKPLKNWIGMVHL